VQDGPFQDTKEQQGGFFLIEAPDLRRRLSTALDGQEVSLGRDAGPGRL
jgi:hypothetical protein